MDSALILEQRLESLETNGFKLLPKTTNPAPLGLFCFGLVTAFLSGIYSELIEPESAGLVWGLAMAMGIAQILVALMEYQRSNIFGVTVFGIFGPFWFCLALFEILAAKNILTVGPKGTAMFLALFGIVSFLLWLTTFSLNVAVSLLMLILAILFFILSAGQFHPTTLKAGGIFGFLVAGLAIYIATAGMLSEMYGFQVLPVFPLKPINQIATGRLGGFGTRKHVTTREPEPADKV